MDKPPEWIIYTLQTFAKESTDASFECDRTWIHDGMCDDTCQTDECSGDVSDCNIGCVGDNYCGSIYTYWEFLIGNNDRIYAANYSVVCNEWIPKMKKYVELSSITQDFDIFDPAKCQIFLLVADFNEDGYINFREFTAFFSLSAPLGHSQHGVGKGIGTNCSLCVGDTYNINMNELE